MNSDLRIFLACASYAISYGGPAVTVPQLAASLSGEGVEVGIWSPDGTACTSVFLGGSSRIHRLNGTLSEALSTFGQVDLIHDNGIWLHHNHILAAIAAARGIPRLVSTRGMLEPWAFAHKRWRKRIAWWAYQRRDLVRASYLHTTSEQEADNLKRLGLGVPVSTVANGVDIPDDQDLAKNRAIVRREGKMVALFLGRLYPVKGLPMLLEAWSRVRPNGWELHIAGPDEGGHRRALQDAVSKFGLRACVSFLGEIAVQDRLRVYAGADLFILPSYSESFGMAIAEALAHSLPVLTTTGVPWPRLPAKGCGWRVAPTANTLSDALREATSLDISTLLEMGRKGRELVAADYSWLTVAKSMSELYRAAVQRHRLIERKELAPHSA